MSTIRHAFDIDVYLLFAASVCFGSNECVLLIEAGHRHTAASNTAGPRGDGGGCVSSGTCVGPVYQVLALSSAERRVDSNP